MKLGLQISQNYSKVNVPVVPGYYADKSVIPEKPTEQKDLVEKVVYKPMGKITPVDPKGNPIPDAPTPQYPNDQRIQPRVEKRQYLISQDGMSYQIQDTPGLTQMVTRSFQINQVKIHQLNTKKTKLPSIA